MPSPNGGGPEGTTPQGLTENKSSPRTADKPAESASASSIGEDAAGRKKRGRTSRRPPRASASLYAPVPGRGLVALSIRCPRCGGVHMGRVRPGTEAAGKRRTPCGTVVVVIRSRYAPEVTA